MFKKSLLALAAISAIGFSTAQASDLSYSYVQGSYTETEMDISGEDLDTEGLNLSGSVELGKLFFVTVDFGTLEGNDRIFGLDVDAEADTRTLGFGLHTALNDKLDFVASVARSSTDFTIDIEGDEVVDDDADATLVSLGVRGMATDSLELFANAIYVDGEDDSDTHLNVGGMYHVTSNVGLGLSFTSADDADATSVFARLSF